MTILAYISGTLLGISIAGIIYLKLIDKELKELDSINQLAIALADKYHNRLMRIGNFVIDNSEKIGDKLSEQIIGIITEDVEKK